MAKKKSSAEPPTSTRRELLLGALQRARARLAQRRELLLSVPRRGYTAAMADARLPLEYEIPTSGAAEVLRLITEGKLDVVTETLIDGLIEELSA